MWSRRSPKSVSKVLFAAGTVGDLYKALAKACGVASENPSDLLLLVEISLAQVHRMFTEMKDRLADVIQRHSLLAYKYSSVEEGPASGGKELHVFQRHVFIRPLSSPRPFHQARSMRRAAIYLRAPSKGENLPVLTELVD